MKFLLDTNTLLFWLEGSRRIDKRLLARLVDPANTVYVSAVSAFEIAVKASLKRLKLPDAPSKVLPPFFAQSGLTTLPVTMEHSFGVFALPHHHSDPFDRLLISQAIAENLTLVTSDKMLKQYPATVILLKT